MIKLQLSSRSDQELGLHKGEYDVHNGGLFLLSAGGA